MPTTHARAQRWYELRDIAVAHDLSTIRLLAVPYSTWTNLGWGDWERMLAGVFDKSIREARKGIPLLLFHDNRSIPIGKSAGFTLDDPAGLIGTWDIDLASEIAREASRTVRDGYLNGASVGFQPIRYSVVWNDEDAWDPAISRESGEVQVSHQEARLLETSLTPTPAFADAGVRSIDGMGIRRPERDTVRPVGMNLDTQVAIRDAKDLAARFEARP